MSSQTPTQRTKLLIKYWCQNSELWDIRNRVKMCFKGENNNNNNNITLISVHQHLPSFTLSD